MIATGHNLLVPACSHADKRENVPLIRVKKLICQYVFLVWNVKFHIAQNLFWLHQNCVNVHLFGVG